MVPYLRLCLLGNYDLRVDLEDFEGNQRYAEYNNFKVDDEKDDFQLNLGQYNGNAGDALSDAPSSAGQQWINPGVGSNRVKFSTFDHPDDDTKCIRHSNSGWWFSRCDAGNLNGHYYKGPYQAMTDDGVVWYTWHGWWYSIKSVVMMVRAADLEQPPPVMAPLQAQSDINLTPGIPDHPNGH
ncbi:fibrinogen-like protein 1 [Scomber scombrus]|uniref:fibrinogen-like protein 1 n=1 Tax=Scomber scombrus TaxID=13677 RepID=UPI002DD80915|nr:fibrinogen-like protein 1 [Scomber scombrus]